MIDQRGVKTVVSSHKGLTTLSNMELNSYSGVHSDPFLFVDGHIQDICVNWRFGQGVVVIDSAEMQKKQITKRAENFLRTGRAIVDLLCTHVRICFVDFERKC